MTFALFSLKKGILSTHKIKTENKYFLRDLHQHGLKRRVNIVAVMYPKGNKVNTNSIFTMIAYFFIVLKT